MKAAVVLAAIVFAGALALVVEQPIWTTYGIALLILLWGSCSLLFQADWSGPCSSS